MSWFIVASNLKRILQYCTIPSLTQPNSNGRLPSPTKFFILRSDEKKKQFVRKCKYIYFSSKSIKYLEKIPKLIQKHCIKLGIYSETKNKIKGI